MNNKFTGSAIPINAFTGMTESWTALPNGTCADWTSESSADQLSVGNSVLKDAKSISSQVTNCNFGAGGPPPGGLYCAQQP